MSYENLQGDIGSSSGQYVKMGTSGTASTLALTTSNVGIGTTTPSSRLDVSGGSINIPQEEALRSTGNYIIGEHSGNLIQIGSGAVANDFVFSSSGSQLRSPTMWPRRSLHCS